MTELIGEYMGASVSWQELVSELDKEAEMSAEEIERHVVAEILRGGED